MLEQPGPYKGVKTPAIPGEIYGGVTEDEDSKDVVGLRSCQTTAEIEDVEIVYS